MAATEMYCTACGAVGKPKTHTKGSMLIEIFLWLMLIVPGIVYSLWRLTSRQKVCATCQSPNIIPSNSPNAQAALAAKR